MRKLVWFSVGFTSAMALSAYWLSDESLIPLAIIVGLLALGFLLLHISKHLIIFTILLGMSLGIVHNWCYDQMFLSDIRQFDGMTLPGKITATDYSFSTDFGGAVDGEIEVEGIECDVRLYYYEPMQIKPGDILTGNMRLRYTPAGGKDPTTYHKGEGIFLLAYADEALEHKSVLDASDTYFAAHLRKNITEQIEAVFPEDTAFFAKALLLGDDGDIGYEDNVAFQKSGMRHIVAVSGLHVSILFSVLYFLTGRKRHLSLLVGFPLLLIFAAVAGFTPSVVRACIMQALVLLAAAVDREYDPATALSFSVLVILFLNPLAITSVSFQLSVGCMVGIFAFSHRVRGWLLHVRRMGKYSDKGFRGKIIRWFAGSVSVSVSAMTFTLPLCAIYFNMVSLIGIVANLLTLWIISFIFCGVVVACIASVIWMPLGTMIALPISLAIKYVLLVARALSKMPFSVAYTDSIYTVAWIVVAYVLFTAFFVLKQKRIVPLAITVLALYGFSLLATWAEPYFDSVRISAIDVGQGQCILIQSKSSAYLIDCGGENPENTASAAMNWIGSQGISHLDGIILTHYDSDHANGAEHLLQIMKVDKLYLPESEPDSPIRNRLIDQSVSVDMIDHTTQIQCDTGKLVLIPSESDKTGNESSMCILFQGENCDILITGDRDIQGERELLSQYDIGDIDILVAGHHGAATSNGMDLLSGTKPEIILISVGADNNHGHPDQGVINRFENADSIIYRTDIDGTIMIRG